ncbi:MAG: glucose-6-phosphate isomerase [Bdellovibrionota bacterium]
MSRNWIEFKENFYFDNKTEFSLDLGNIGINKDVKKEYAEKFEKVFKEMEALEKGGIANVDENRMVGHYWLRLPSLAPSSEIKEDIENVIIDIKNFSNKIHSGAILSSKNEKFESLLLIGIGGSALGPQFLSDALSSKNDKMQVFFFDNTDPDGMQKVLDKIPSLEKTLCIVISKSGGTKETRNGMLVAQKAFKDKNLDYTKHFVAVTSKESELDKVAKKENWIKTFPMWDFIGGRTSETSVVGLLPASLQGFDIDEFLQGASYMDELTRNSVLEENPSALLAMLWCVAGNGKGEKDMVILPYKDRLELFSKYLQQLIMESLGKKEDRDGNFVYQGISVYGNKGSTDQHAYIQQLRDGLDNFFATFISVLASNSKVSTSDKMCKFQVEDNIDAGDYLFGFFQGTQIALAEGGKRYCTITIKELSPFSVGMLIALFERAVGFYASLININAYHQPGVEAGKKAAAKILDLKLKVQELLSKESTPQSLDDIAFKLEQNQNMAVVFRILRHLEANNKIKDDGAAKIFDRKYTAV